jgi:putative FmdB family regulatory protein
MPIYEYRCEKCGEFEQTQRISDPALDRCPTCRRKVRRLISSTSFQLKGSGWYVTDYARAGRNSGGKDSAKDSETSSSKSESKTESKSESKTESKTESKVDSKAQSKGEAKAAAS